MEASPIDLCLLLDDDDMSKYVGRSCDLFASE